VLKGRLRRGDGFLLYRPGL